MKKAFRRLLLPLVSMVLCLQCEKEPSVDLVDIPDDAFLEALIAVGVDLNGDRKISAYEAAMRTSLHINPENLNPENYENGNITDLTGIEDFIYLDSLNCSFHHISTLDISKNTFLIYQNCSVNQFSSLDVSANVELRDLNCGNNNLSSLDLSNNPDLRFLMCLGNQLSNLDLSNNPALSFLDCSYNQLSSLNISQNTGLVEFYCNGNPLTSLDISNNTSLGWVYMENMPSLHEVCVWETPFPPNHIPYVSTENSPNIYFTTECSQ